MSTRLEYYLYVNKTVWPHVLMVDPRLKVGNHDVKYCKITKREYKSFMGIVVSDKEIPISELHDDCGQFVTNNIPLEAHNIWGCNAFSLRKAFSSTWEQIKVFIDAVWVVRAKLKLSNKLMYKNIIAKLSKDFDEAINAIWDADSNIHGAARNFAICHTTTKLIDGETVIFTVYDQVNKPMGDCLLIVMELE